MMQLLGWSLFQIHSKELGRQKVGPPKRKRDCVFITWNIYEENNLHHMELH